MAQKRMVDKKISVSEQVANLPRDGQCLFTWLICHADDIGLLPASPKTIRAMVVPMWEISADGVESLLGAMIREGLLDFVTIDAKQYYLIPNFRDYQNLRRDRQPQTILPIKLDDDSKKSWAICDAALLRANGIQRHDSVMSPTWQSHAEYRIGKDRGV